MLFHLRKIFMVTELLRSSKLTNYKQTSAAIPISGLFHWKPLEQVINELADISERPKFRWYFTTAGLWRPHEVRIVGVDWNTLKLVTCRGKTWPLSIIALKRILISLSLSRKMINLPIENPYFTKDEKLLQLFWKNVKAKKRHEISIMSKVYFIDLGQSILQ